MVGSIKNPVKKVHPSLNDANVYPLSATFMINPPATKGCGQVGQVGVRGWPGWSSGREGSGHVGQVGVRGVVRLVKWW